MAWTETIKQATAQEEDEAFKTIVFAVCREDRR